MKYWRETLAVAQRILVELVRRWRSLVFWGIFPLSILVINGLILDDRTPLSRAEAFQQTAPSTLVGAALFFSCLGGTVATVVAEREQQTLKRLLISPLSGISYFLGILLAHSTIGIGQTLLVYAVIMALGGTITGSLVLSGTVIVLTIVTYVGVGFLLGTQLAQRTDDVNTLVASFGIPLLLLGGAFIPVEFFPAELLNFAEFNPVYHMNQALTGIAADGKTLEDVSSHLWFVTGCAGITILGSWLAYRRMLCVERRL